MQRWRSQRCWCSSLLSERPRRVHGGQRRGTDNHLRSVWRWPVWPDVHGFRTREKADTGGGKSHKRHAGIERATFLLRSANRRRFRSNLPRDEIVSHGQKCTERLRTCNKFSTPPKKIKTLFPFVRLFERQLHGICCTTSVRLGPWESTEWTDREDRWRAALSHRGL